MRATTFILSCFLLGGCATNAKKPLARQEEPEATLASYQDAPAAALVFDLPHEPGERPVELTRDERQPAAFVGFDGPISTSFWIYQDDWQDVGARDSGGWGGGLRSRFQRDAMVSQTGVRTRGPSSSTSEVIFRAGRLSVDRIRA